MRYLNSVRVENLNQEKEETGEYKPITPPPADDNKKDETVETKEYTVKSGDNLSRIAKANNMKFMNIEPGNIIRIPASYQSANGE